MPLMTLHAAVELLPVDDEIARDADIQKLRSFFPDVRGQRGVTMDSDHPFSHLRVAWEFNLDQYEAIHVKVMLPGIAESHSAIDNWMKRLVEELPSMGPEILGALAYGIVHMTFDCNAEGWTFVPETLGAHERMRMYSAARETIMGRVEEDIQFELTESADPKALPALLAQCPLPDTGY